MDRLDRTVVHEICTNQVVVTLQACVKELVENSLDAGASRIEVRLRENGADLLEVVDNGRGIAAEDFEKLAQRHATSKIRNYDDLSSNLATFGFRGEALSAISAMGQMTVCTRTAASTVATMLTYDRFGVLTKQEPTAREVGTTVTVRDLFSRLPVRHKEFLRNAQTQVAATLKLIQSYAIGQSDVRFSVVTEKVKGQRATVMCTSGTASSLRHATAAVLGDAAVADVRALELHSQATGWTVSGLVSTPEGGRRSRDFQLFFVNRRPIDPPKRIIKLLNDTYRQYNSKLWPLLVLSFTAAQGLVDVNVTPDKRTVFLHNEEALLADLQQALTELFVPAQRSLSCGLGSFSIAPVAASEPVLTKSPPGAREALARLDDLEVRTPDTSATKRSWDTLNKPGDLETPEKCPTPQVEAPAQVQLKKARGSPIKASTVSLPGFILEEYVPEPPEELIPSRPSELVPPSAQTYALPPDHAIQEEGAPPDDYGGLLVMEEYHPEQDDTVAAPMDDSGEGTFEEEEILSPEPEVKLPAIGPSITVNVSIEQMAADIERRRLQRQAGSPRPAAAAAISFPGAFSLAALRPGEQGASLEEIAAFSAETGAAGQSGFRFDKSCFSQMRVIGQFNLGFIIAALRTAPSEEHHGGPGSTQLFIVDQHASDEKVRFEDLNRRSRIDKQPLVRPLTLQLSPAQESIAEAHIETLRLNGFDLHLDEAKPPGRRLAVKALPTCQGMVFGEKDIQEFLHTLEESGEVPQLRPPEPRLSQGAGLLDLTGHRGLRGEGAIPRPPKVWQLLACRACRGAIMIGRALRVSEMEKVLANLGTLEQPWNCPHGRPTMRHLIDVSAARQAPKPPPPLAKLIKR